MRSLKNSFSAFALTLAVLTPGITQFAYSQTAKPPLHGAHWIAITGKPLGATAGARIFQQGGNAVDAACAMLAAVATVFDDVSWGGETQALIFNPQTKKVIGINGCGVAPSGATAEYFKGKGLKFPPGEGPESALTPGNAGAIMIMLAEFGTLSLKQVLTPAMELAAGFPVEEELASKIKHNQGKLQRWPYSKSLFLIHPDRDYEGPRPGEIFRQPDLLMTLEKLVEAETKALQAGQSRKQAIQAAYDRFYRGDIAEEFVRGSREQGGLHTLEDLKNWEVKLEPPVSTTYKNIEVYKLTTWTQGPVLLQLLNLLEPQELSALSYNSARYIHTLYQAMNLAFADRDFYYGDPSFPPAEPVAGLLSKAYARERWLLVNPDHNDPAIRPGDPYPFQDQTNPWKEQLRKWPVRPPAGRRAENTQSDAAFDAGFRAGTTSIQAADIAGWAVSITPSGGWIPPVIAGHTGVGMSQRMQSFVLDASDGPFNVVAPGKRPRVTLSPTLAVRHGQPLLCFSVQGGDTQEQNLLQFFLNVVEFGMTIQQACEAANFASYQMRASFDRHESKPGRLTINESIPPWVGRELTRMGYSLDLREKTSGPLTAIFFDWDNNSLWGGASDDGEDYGIAW